VRVVATAGHVDHGKSTLVHALTGTDPDRFAEEKARGLTIDLGFAFTTLPSGAEVAFVDVPGHVRFLKNMLAGVGAVDACLFVVDAVEGWKPQSEEHLRILELLGVGHGLVVLTKAGLTDDDGTELARLEVEERVAGTFLAGAEVVATDAVDGTGMDGLRAARDRRVRAPPAAADRARPRLWVDRSFAAKGSGTVVTGTLTGGAVAVDDELEVVRVAGPVRRARVRGLQSHASALAVADPGRRLAVNLTGVAHREVARGDALVRPGQWAPSRMLDASLTVLAALDHEVTRRGAYVLYVGSGEHPVRLRVLGPEALAPGETGAVRREPAAPHPYVVALEASPFAPPTPEEAGVPRSELRDLLRLGLVVERDGMHFAAAAVAEAARRVAAVLATSPEGATASRLREALGTSRKYALPLLNLLDAEGITRRRGDLRIGGPRLPHPDPPR
jgi:selenocysteine-specific elongation factor